MLEKIFSFKLDEIIKKVTIGMLIFWGLFLYGLTFIPENIAKSLNIFEIINPYKNILSLFGLLSVGLIVYKIFSCLVKKYNANKNLKQLQETLHNLTPEEKAYLLPYIEDKENTLYISPSNGVMSGLSCKNITYSPSRIFQGRRDYNLQTWAREYLEPVQNLFSKITINAKTTN